MKNIIQANSTDAEKPCYHHRCKQESDPVGSIMLKGKQGYQYDTSNWNLNICKIIVFEEAVFHVTSRFKTKH